MSKMILQVHLPSLNLLYSFFGRGEERSRDIDVTIVLALNRNSALTGIFFGNTLRYRYFGCLLLCEVSQKSTRGISRYLGISTKGCELCMNRRLEVIQTNLLFFGCFRKVFITHSFSLRGRRLKGKGQGVLGKGVLGARETRGTREKVEVKKCILSETHKELKRVTRVQCS